MIYPIVSFAYGDVNGDKIPDNVYLTGIQTEDSPFVQKITLVIQDGKTGGIRSVYLGESSGYNPVITLRDFNGDGVEDIFISIASGGSGGTMYYYIYSFINNSPRLLFDYKVYNQDFQYDIIYQNDYKVLVRSHKNHLDYIIDISLKDSTYLNEIYDTNGKLKESITGFINPISGLYPIDFNSDKVYELLAYQKIAGRFNADSLGYVQNVLKWDRDHFVFDEQYVAIFGY